MDNKEFQAEAELLSRQFGICQVATRSFLTYFSERVQNVEAFAKIAKDGTPAQKLSLLEQGMRAWHEHGRAFYNEILENKTENAKKFRQMIFDEVQAAAKAGK